MIFDLSVRGHHPIYIQHLLRYWHAHQLSVPLDIVITPRFLWEHADVIAFAARYSCGKLNFVPISSAEEAALNPRTSRLQRAYRNVQEWRLFRHYAATLRATHGLSMYVDTCALPLALGFPSPCPFSGIYFRPSFHYGLFTPDPPSLKDRLQQWREKRTLARIFRHPQLQHVFCLDPFAVHPLNQFQTQVTSVHVPDPIQRLEQSDLDAAAIVLKEQLKIEPGRMIFLLFGALTKRKGINQLLDAISILSPDLCQKICLLVVGESNLSASLETRIAYLCKSRPVQIIQRYEFIPESEVQPYFQVADVVLAPYQRHVGMSGILLLAAASGTPLLSSDYGLMGEIVRRQQLGLTIDSASATEIAGGLTRFLLEDPTQFYDYPSMQAFVAQHSAEQFASVIFNTILNDT